MIQDESPDAADDQSSQSSAHESCGETQFKPIKAGKHWSPLEVKLMAQAYNKHGGLKSEGGKGWWDQVSKTLRELFLEVNIASLADHEDFQLRRLYVDCQVRDGEQLKRKFQLLVREKSKAANAGVAHVSKKAQFKERRQTSAKRKKDEVSSLEGNSAVADVKGEALNARTGTENDGLIARLMAGGDDMDSTATEQDLDGYNSEESYGAGAAPAAAAAAAAAAAPSISRRRRSQPVGHQDGSPVFHDRTLTVSAAPSSATDPGLNASVTSSASASNIKEQKIAAPSPSSSASASSSSGAGAAPASGAGSSHDAGDNAWSQVIAQSGAKPKSAKIRTTTPAEDAVARTIARANEEPKEKKPSAQELVLSLLVEKEKAKAATAVAKPALVPLTTAFKSVDELLTKLQVDQDTKTKMVDASLYDLIGTEFSSLKGHVIATFGLSERMAYRIAMVITQNYLPQ